MFSTKHKPHGYWKDWSNVERELQTTINKLGHFPTERELRQLGLGNLMLCPAIIRYHGGMKSARKKMGYSEAIKPNGYWQSWDNFKQELQTVIQQLGHFPKRQELNSLRKHSLQIAIGKYYGGMDAVRLRLQEEGVLPSEEDQLEQLVERYVEK